MASRARLNRPAMTAVNRRRVPMGEPELEAFYARVFLPLVRRATWKHRLSPEDASDIVQDAFVLALGKLDSSGNPKAWLVQVVDHLSVNHQRKLARRAHLASKWIGPTEEPDLPAMTAVEGGVDH
jgi:DNA-directed RNA polymerase specialized sigma24 family protein